MPIIITSLKIIEEVKSPVAFETPNVSVREVENVVVAVSPCPDDRQLPILHHQGHSAIIREEKSLN